MSIHGDDVVRTIREALSDKSRSAQAPSQGNVRMYPNPEQAWPNRDGRLVFECVGRDWMRGFRVTVEAIPVADVPLGVGDQWIVVEEDPS